MPIKKNKVGRPSKPESEKVKHINTQVVPSMIEFLDEEAKKTGLYRSTLISNLIEAEYGKRHARWLKRKRKK